LSVSIIAGVRHEKRPLFISLFGVATFSPGRRQIDLFAKTASVDVPPDFTMVSTKSIRPPTDFGFIDQVKPAGNEEHSARDRQNGWTYLRGQHRVLELIR
jgi:hypothetical protein